MRITLIEPWQNPNNRRMVQEDDTLIVLSECCDYNIDSLFRLPNGQSWMRCLNCERLLQNNTASMWNCYVQRVGPSSNGERWDDWGRDIFGYTGEFELVVT